MNMKTLGHLSTFGCLLALILLIFVAGPMGLDKWDAMETSRIGQ